jgi:hypothetical protein
MGHGVTHRAAPPPVTLLRFGASPSRAPVDHAFDPSPVALAAFRVTITDAAS